MPISHKHTPIELPEYIAAHPWEQVVEVGAKKEQNYRAGIEQVKSSIDALNNIPITRGPVKEYLYNKAQELTQAVNKYAGEDLSNPDIVNQLVRFSDPILRDPVIIEEATFTKEKERRLAELAKVPSDKRNAVNDYFHLEDINKWQNSTKLFGNQVQLNKQYKPFEDISKRWFEYIKTQTPDVIKTETRVPGNYINSVKQEGFDLRNPGRLVNGFLATLNGAQKEQLYMDAKYDLLLKGKEAAYNVYKEHYGSALEDANTVLPSYKEELQKQKELYAKVPDPMVRQAISDLQEKIEAAEGIQKVAQNKLKTWTNPDILPEEEYIDLYTKNFLTSLNNAYSYRKYEQDLKEDGVALEMIRQSAIDRRHYENMAHQSRMLEKRQQMQNKSNRIGTNYYSSEVDRLEGIVSAEDREVAYASFLKSAETPYSLQELTELMFNRDKETGALQIKPFSEISRDSGFNTWNTAISDALRETIKKSNPNITEIQLEAQVQDKIETEYTDLKSKLRGIDQAIRAAEKQGVGEIVLTLVDGTQLPVNRENLGNLTADVLPRILHVNQYLPYGTKPKFLTEDKMDEYIGGKFFTPSGDPDKPQ